MKDILLRCFDILYQKLINITTLQEENEKY